MRNPDCFVLCIIRVVRCILIYAGFFLATLCLRNQSITGITVKDTWRKSRGKVEVGEGGGSAGVGLRDGEKRHTTVIE